MTFFQAGTCSVVRIVDFLPYAYGVGLVVLFINGKGKRLGDLAAGTVVVKDSDYVQLWQLPGGRPEPPPSPPAWPLASSPAPPSDMPPPAIAPASQAELVLRRIDPELRRFVTAYARRRPELPLEVRAELAGQVQAILHAAGPVVLTALGRLAAPEHTPVLVL